MKNEEKAEPQTEYSCWQDGICDCNCPNKDCIHNGKHEI